MSPTAPRFDVAIYMPLATGHYRRSGPVGGGAELQTVLLARALATRGVRVAHIVFPVDDPAPPTPSSPSVIERGPDRGDLPLVGGLAEALGIWRSMSRADASVYLFRTGRSRLLAGAAFCQAHRRKLVFAAANDLDFAFESRSIDSPTRAYRAALRRTDAIVAQTEHQLELIRHGLGEDHRATMIPSFVEPAAAATQEPDGFIWIGRLVPYKQPLEYVRLAEALPDRRFRMVFELAEDEPEETKEISRGFVEELRSAAERLPNLELIGQMPRRSCTATYRAIVRGRLDIDPRGDAERVPRGLGAFGSSPVTSVGPGWADRGANCGPYRTRLSFRAGPDRRSGLPRSVAAPGAWPKRPPLREPGARPRGGG